MKKINSIFNRTNLSSKNLKTVILFFIGLVALIWFLVRVIPKPSRAAYPCQQAAFPLASAFVIWLTGILTSSLIFVKAKSKWRRSKYVIAIALFSLAMAVFMVTSTSLKQTPLMAKAYVLTNKILGNQLPAIQYFTEENSMVVEPAAYVGIVKSIQAQAEDIEFDEIESMVAEAIEKAGGLEGIVSDGDTVVLKPNLVVTVDGTAAAQTLLPEVNGITTDYRVMQAVVNIVREINPSGEIYVLEGSADGITSINMDILEYDMITGIDSLVPLEDVSGAWGDTNSVYLQCVSLPSGKALYNGANNRYWMHKLYYNADVLISVPVLKNHCYTGNTGSIKNVGIGATPPTIYADDPPNLLRFGIDHNLPRTNLHYFIHDYYMCRPVDFVVMDGLQSVQNGPVSTNTTSQLADDQMNMRLILAGKDPVAVDDIASLLTGHDPALIPHIFTLHNDSMGCCDARLIRVNGNKVGDEKKDFDIFDSGALSKYDDFEAPDFEVLLCEVVDDQLHLSLSVDEEVNKVEVAVDGVYLNQIVINNFEDFYLDLDTLEVGTSTEVMVYAYDQYLNYSSEDATGWVSVTDPISSFIEFQLYPNPCSSVARLRYLIHDPSTEFILSKAEVLGTGSRYLICDLYRIDGRMIRRVIEGEQMPGEHEIEIDVSDLPAGLYFIKMQAGQDIAVRKLIVR